MFASKFVSNFGQETKMDGILDPSFHLTDFRKKGRPIWFFKTFITCIVILSSHDVIQELA